MSLRPSARVTAGRPNRVTRSYDGPVAEESGWRPLRRPRHLDLHGVASSPFGRLALTHFLAISGDTLITIALAGSLFFSIPVGKAQGRVLLYLLLTMAPFAVVAPLLGPLLDRSRGGRRTVVIVAAAARALVCLHMAGHLNDLLLFPDAFAVLVLSKAYLITKSALVPGVVRRQEGAELVEANSRLALLAVVAGFVAALPGAIVLKVPFLGGSWVLRLAAVVFGTTAFAAARIPREPVRESVAAAEDAEEDELRARQANEAAADRARDNERAELRDAGIRMAATAMAVMRGVVGFFTFLVAFAFRQPKAHVPSWWFGLVIASSLAGTCVGAAVAPRLRRVLAEERILMGSLFAVALVGLVAARVGSRPMVAAVAASIGVASSAGKLAFDSIVQRDAPDAVRGHVFARFETRFQLVWVLGAAVPVLLGPLHRHIEAGLAVIAAAAAIAGCSYGAGRSALKRRRPVPATTSSTP